MSGAPTPPLIVLGFGQNADPSLIVTPLPVPSQVGGRASFSTGFVALNQTPSSAGGVPPFIQDFNAVLLAATANIAAMTGGQYWTFNATWAAQNGGYAYGAIIPMLSGNGWWLNVSPGNTNNPDTSPAQGSGWVAMFAYGTGTVGSSGGTVTLPATVVAQPILIFTGVLSSNLQAILPTSTQEWLVVNSTTGNFSITVKTAAGSGIVIPQGGLAFPTGIWGDGQNINQTFCGLNNIVLSRSTTASVTSNTAAAPDSQLITPPLPAGAYSVSAKLWVQAASGGTNPGVKLFVGSNAGSVSALGYYAGIMNGSAITPQVQSAASIGNGFTTIVATPNVDYLSIEATLQLAAVGQIYVSWAQDVSSTSSSRLLQGSRLTVQAMQG